MVLDPYLTECGERIRGFKRLSPMLIAPEELAVDYYVTSHLHFDHFDYDAIPIVAQCTKRTLFFGPASCQEKFIELGIQAHRCHRLDRGECYQDEKILIRAVMADHGTMAPDAIGLLVAFAGHRLYFSGDTAFHSELFQEIRIFEPDIAVRVHDIFSLMSMVNAGVGYTLIPGRMRGLFRSGIRLLPLQEAYRMEQEISLVFPRSQENHPGLLSLLAECRMYARQLMREDNDVDKVP